MMRTMRTMRRPALLAFVLAMAPLAASARQKAEEPASEGDSQAEGKDRAQTHEAGGHGAHSAAAPPHINWFHWHYGKDVRGGELQDGEEPMPPGFLFALVNFAVFLALLIKFAGPKLATYLRVRHDTVKSQLDEAARLRADARAKLDEYSRRLAALDQEVTRLMHEIRADADAEREAILAQARAQAEAIMREAEGRIESEIARARLSLEREVVTAAVAAAEKILAERTTPDDQARLFDGFIANLVAVGSGEPPGPGGPGGGDGSPDGRRRRRTTVDEDWGS